MPAGAVDTHAHVIGLPPEHPFVEGRAYTPPAAPPSAYLAMLDGAGSTYGVLIQVSVHGTDNRLMLATLRANPQRLRGIAVAPLGLPDKEWRAMREAGVVGLRLNVLYGGGIGFERLADYGALCRDMGWHLQFLLDARELPALAPAISRLPVPFVVDHMGHFPASLGVKEPGFDTVEPNV
jgi:predicted TIM-barrel fold metal-dependent hydrolase